MTSARCCGSASTPIIAVPGTLALGSARNSSRVWGVQITPYFFSPSLGPSRLLVVPAWRPRTPISVGPTLEVSPLVTPWQVTQALVVTSSLPRSGSPLRSPAWAAGAQNRVASASRRMDRIADIDVGSPEYGGRNPPPQNRTRY